MSTTEETGSPAKPLSPVQVFRRLPPTLQLMSECADFIREELNKASEEAFQKGFNIDQICNAICTQANDFGYNATVHPTEVMHSSFPSFPGQTIMACYILIDLQEREESNWLA